jgi:hypothetical protein
LDCLPTDWNFSLSKVTRDLVADLIDACLYELGCVEIGSNTKAILLEESDLPATIQIDDHFGDRGHQIIELIVASREYQLS